MKNIKKNAQGYGYKYTDLAEIHKYLESINCDYIQRIAVIDGVDYIETLRSIDGEWEQEWIRGSRVIQATLSGKNNPAQEQRKWFNVCKEIFTINGIWISHNRRRRTTINTRYNK